MHDPRVVFLRRCEELARLRTLRTEYEIVSLALPLRALLFDDGEPLLHRVNRTHRAAVEWWVWRQVLEPAPPPSADDLPSPSFQWRLLTRPGPERDYVRVPLQKFLSIKVAWNDAKAFSVRDVVATCANARGAVHFDDNVSKHPLLGLDDSIARTFATIGLHDVAATTRILLNIAETTVEALRAIYPLVKQDVEQNPG